jgi:hypothetical protein
VPVKGSPKHYRAITSALIVASTMLFVAAYALQVTSIPNAARNGYHGNWNSPDESLIWALLMLSAGAVGVAVARKRPDNRIGWVFAGGAFTGTAALAGDQWAAYALVVAPGTLPGGTLGYFLSFPGLFITWALLGVIVPLMFPDGRISGRFGRAVAAMGVASAVMWTSEIFRPDLFRIGDSPALADIQNPLAMPGTTEVLSIVNAVGLFGLFGTMFLAIASLVPRTLRATGVRRQQLKVVAYTAVVTTILSMIGANLLNVEGVRGTLLVPIINVVLTALTIAIPVSFGVAILKYRLYDLDLIINRTLVYTALTAVLTVVYVGGVIVLGAIVRSIADQANNDFSIAASTLAVAGLFRPVRGHIQTFIDRRFYRRRYDARAILESFALTLKGEVDLSSMEAELLRVAQQTLQPAHVSVWLKTPTLHSALDHR